jgi:hypothetical protein
MSLRVACDEAKAGIYKLKVIAAHCSEYFFIFMISDYARLSFVYGNDNESS